MKTNLKTFACGILAATALTPLLSCNDEDSGTEITLPSSATVRSFSLAANKNVLPNLDSVYFSIDLYTGEIFNADSLPYGTSTSKLVPVILTDGAQLAELSVPRPGAIDTVYNYLENTTDSVDFSNGPVKLRIVSLDGKTERNYTIRVNVHTVPTDTLVWSRLESGNLPTLLSAVNEQHTAMSPDGRFYCLTRYSSDYSLCTTDNPSASWSGLRPSFGFEPDVNSLTATTDALYILDKNGRMYASRDNGVSWSDTGETVAGILGAYRGQVLATSKVADTWAVLEYPTGICRPVPASTFPIRNTSGGLTITYEMGVQPQFVITGGRLADGTLTDRTWGFDGTGWADLTKTPLPEALENLAVVPYFDVQPDTISWRVSTKTTVLLAMNGNSDDGRPNDVVYMSADFGMHWAKAPENLQISTKVIPARTRTQAYPYTITRHAAKTPHRPLTDRLTMSWTDLGYNRRLLPLSRVSGPLTEWDVPYIYLFGGISGEGTTYNTVFRGAITSLTLKPLQ